VRFDLLWCLFGHYSGHTALGYQLRTLGKTNPKAARYAGQSIPLSDHLGDAHSGGLAVLFGI